MRIAKIDERERQRIAADIVSAQYHSPGLQRAKFDDLCKKYGRKFVQQFYADLVMQTNPEKVPLKIWDWAACNCTEQHHYAAMLEYANKTATDNGIMEIIKTAACAAKNYKRSKNTMKAKDYYDQAVAELKKFCADNTNFDVQVVEEIYPLEVHFVPSATQLSFFPDQYTNEDGEIGFISVVCGIESTVKISLKLAIENSLLKKMISKAETIGKLYLHQLREEMLEKTAAAQRKRRETMAAIKAARKGGAPCVSST